MNNKISLELLAPAKDLESGVSAINCGADAVYIGAPKFGARSAAGNPISDIKKLVDYAHKFWARVYVTINTIIYDNELGEVEKLITELYGIGTDAIIFQDMSILEMNLPPIPLFASTQTHNYEIERIKFLDNLGIKRIILARELSLDQIKEIKANTKTELEFFVHGALCVSMSGQCYLSESMFGRSANRGECAQPCRLEYSLIDANGKIIVENKHMLSIRDLNLSDYLSDLIEAGVTSFKIEGRLKDISYVKNITAYYRQQLDSIIQCKNEFKKSSSGNSIIPFTPDPDKTFNRGYTSYIIDGKDKFLGSIDSPKSKGKYLGRVNKISKNGFSIGTREKIVNGDGLCFYDSTSKLTGMYVNRSEGNFVFTNNLDEIKIGTEIYRNYDHIFSAELDKDCARKIRTEIIIEETETGLKVLAVDEDGVKSESEFSFVKEIAVNKNKAQETFISQFTKSGDTIFEITKVDLLFDDVIFLPIKTINEMRRNILFKLESERIKMRPVQRMFINKSLKPVLSEKLDYRSNVVNKLSEKFYKDRGAVEIEKGFELQQDHGGKELMITKYCIKDELDACPFKNNTRFDEPLFLVNNNRKYRLQFDCNKCVMKIVKD